MDFLIGIVDGNADCVWAMRPSDQVNVMQDYYEDTEHLSEMVAEFAFPASGPVADGASTEFLRLLKAAFAADLMPKATAEGRAEAFRALGELVSNWAYNHAQKNIDAFIDDNWDDLLAAAEDDGADELYERDRDARLEASP